MEPHELLRMYHAALAEGVSLADVNAELAATTEFKTYAALTRAVFEGDKDERAESLERVASREPGIGGLIASSLIDKLTGGVGVPDVDVARGTEDFARTAAQGASFGFADEIAGLLGGDAELSRQRIEDLRTVEPVGTVLGEIAGAVPSILAPAVAGVRAAGARGGAAVGGAAGAAVGVGEGSGSLTERVVGGVVGV